MTANGPAWITVPVQAKGNYLAQIKDVRIKNDRKWQKKILGTIYNSYRKAPFFETYFLSLEELMKQGWVYLLDLAQASVNWAFEQLGRPRNFLLASNMGVEEQNSVERLILLCQKAGANCYLSGPSAKAYIGDGDAFAKAGIELNWMDYPSYPKYYNEPDVNLSIIDLLFNVGSRAHEYIWKDHNDEPID